MFPSPSSRAPDRPLFVSLALTGALAVGFLINVRADSTYDRATVHVPPPTSSKGEQATLELLARVDMEALAVDTNGPRSPAILHFGRCNCPKYHELRNDEYIVHMSWPHKSANPSLYRTFTQNADRVLACGQDAGHLTVELNLRDGRARHVGLQGSTPIVACMKGELETWAWPAQLDGTYTRTLHFGAAPVWPDAWDYR